MTIEAGREGRKGPAWVAALPNVYLVHEVHAKMQPPGVPCECRDCHAARTNQA